MEANVLRPAHCTDALGAAIAINSQGCSWQVSHPDLGPIDRGEVSFAEAFPDVAGKGWLDCGTGDVITAPMLFVEALELILKQMAESKRFSIQKISCLAGAAQQHGQVLVTPAFGERLRKLDPCRTMAEQLRDAFARPWSTTWMNSSTADDCAAFADYLPGGAADIAAVTGSMPTPRFFGPALRAIARMECGYWGRCRKVLLISNFGASLLLGRVAPLDYSDASGGNVLDLRRRCWSPEILAAFEKDAPNIAVLLPDVVASDQILGRLSPYLVERFGFHPSTLVLPWAGDNADSLLGVGVFDPKRCVRVISKGTSETEFCLLPPGTYCDPTGAGSVFAAVTEAQQNMGINTRRNATLALEAVKHRHRIANWDEFSECLHRTPPANHGKYMIGLFRPEIVPRTSVPIVEYHGGLTNEQTDAEVRAIVESTAMIRQIHNCWMGPPAALYLATGGGSVNREILQVEADVAGVSFFMPTTGDSVVNGGCIRAMHSVAPMTYTWEYLTARHCEPGTEIKPQSSGVYGDLKRMFEVSLDQALALHGRSTS